ncbi:hypothetical protein [Rhodoferax lithotrophicus]|nr:hypothetical protein [Rhodoferax sp. MIZ03]
MLTDNTAMVMDAHDKDQFAKEHMAGTVKQRCNKKLFGMKLA